MTIDLGVLHALAKQRGLVLEELFSLVENALVLAYMKQPGAIKGSRAVIDRTTGDFAILAPELDDDNQKIDEFDDTPNNFGRIAAATVRQVLSQRLRDAEDASVLGEFKDREGTLASGVIQQGNNPPAWFKSIWELLRPYSPRMSRFPENNIPMEPVFVHIS